MKANEYIKKYGIDCANDILKHNEDLMNLVFFKDLKRLVESHELVGEFDDLEQAKSWIPDMDDEMPYQVRGSSKRFFKGQLIEAIADVESCQ